MSKHSIKQITWKKINVSIRDTAGNAVNETIEEAGFFARLFRKMTRIRVGGKNYTVVTSELESKITKVYRQALGIKKTKTGDP